MIMTPAYPSSGPASATRSDRPCRLPTRLGQACTLLVAMLASVVLAGGCESMPRLRDLTEPAVAPAQVGPLAKGTFHSEPDIRVRVLKGVGTLELGGPAQLLVRRAGVGVGTPTLAATPVKISSGPEGVVVVDARGGRRAWGFGTDVEVLSADGQADGVALSPTQSIRVDKTSYPGFVTIRPRWNDDAGRFDVVVTMAIESYLPGVLTHELFRDWPRQTYEAQAVAARTYALHERWRARGENRAFDVEDTEADQVFGGATTLPRPIEAVRATRGMVVTDRGRIIRAYYSSTCGGRPASAGDTWPRRPDTRFNLSPILQAKGREHACQQATFYRWSTTRDADEVTQRLRAWGRQFNHPVAQVGRVRGVEVATRNEADRPSVYTLTDDAGREYKMTAEELRMGLNQAVSGLPPITRENRVQSGDLAIQAFGTRVTISGRGWGHGVGMCQWCAKGFADLGWDWRRMIATFYPGSEVVQAY